MLDQTEQKRVRRIVRQFLTADYDRDAIVQNIVVYAWQHNMTTVPRMFIRHRCTDAYRRKRREKSFVEQLLPAEHERTSDIDSELINRLVGVLTPFERKLIWMRFYTDLTLEEIAARVRTSRADVSETLTTAIFKMRQEVTDADV